MRYPYEIRTYDVWGNDEDGYTVNDSTVAERGTIDARTINSDKALMRFIRARMCGTRGPRLEVDNNSSDFNYVYFNEKKTGKPFCEITIETGR